MVNYFSVIYLYWTRNWSLIAAHLVIVGATLFINLRLRRFNSDRDEILQYWFWNKYASIDGVGFLIWRHTFKMAAGNYSHFLLAVCRCSGISFNPSHSSIQSMIHRCLAGAIYSLLQTKSSYSVRYFAHSPQAHNECLSIMHADVMDRLRLTIARAQKRLHY